MLNIADSINHCLAKLTINFDMSNRKQNCDEPYMQCGFTSIVVRIEKNQSILCNNTLNNDFNKARKT